MKQYIVKVIVRDGEKDVDMFKRFEDALNNPPENYHVDGWQGIAGDDEVYRRYVIVYKLDDPKVDVVSTGYRKFKGDNE